MTLLIDGNSLTIEDLIRVSKEPGIRVILSETAKINIKKSKDNLLKQIQEDKPLYGINTGFGFLSNTKISLKDSLKLQINLIRSHSIGTGNPLSKEIVRAMLLLRANALSKGYSGVSISLIEKILELLNLDIYPYIPEQGSLGASGDLAPLSHLALCLIGEGECFIGNARIPTSTIFKEKNISPIILNYKEGLALINGTQMMAAFSCFCVDKAYKLLKNSLISSCMCIEALRGTDKAFDNRVSELRPHHGQIKISENLKLLLHNSPNLKEHKTCSKVQDAYSIRCIPQILGPVLETIDFVSNILKKEINSVTDNPLVFTNEVISAGNFHGEYLALAMDYLKIAVSELGSHSERLIERLVNPDLSCLPPFLVNKPGLNSGFMIAQYVAASLVSENKVLSHPASVDSISSSANQEDHVSMGAISARNAYAVINNVEKIIALNYLVSAQGIDFLDKKPSLILENVYKLIRQEISFLDEDRVLYTDLEKLTKLIDKNILIDKVKEHNSDLFNF